MDVIHRLNQIAREEQFGIEQRRAGGAADRIVADEREFVVEDRIFRDPPDDRRHPAFGFAIDVVLLTMAIRGVDFNVDRTARLLVSASGLTNAVAWFLGFTPPAWYVRWVSGGGRSAASA